MNTINNSRHDPAMKVNIDEIADHQTSQSGWKIFNTFELLEEILMHLPPRDLLKAQRVCRVFKETIDNSPPIQRTLFKKGVALKDVYSSSPDGRSWVFKNGNLAEPRLRAVENEAKKCWVKILPVVPNTLLFNDAPLITLLDFPVIFNPGSRAYIQSSGRFAVGSLTDRRCPIRIHEIDLEDQKPTVNMSGPESFRNMFLTRPACPVVVYDIAVIDQSGKDCNMQGTLEREEGITLQDLLNRAFETGLNLGWLDKDLKLSKVRLRRLDFDDRLSRDMHATMMLDDVAHKFKNPFKLGMVNTRLFGP